MTHYIIITGTSRGLGEAIAKNLITPGNHLFCISRSKNERLIQQAQTQAVPLEYFEHNLNDTNKTEQLFEHIFKNINLNTATAISLFNNAGQVVPIKPLDRCEAAELTNNLQVNLLAAMVASAIFIKHTTSINIEKRIINISSGAAIKGHYGWSAYCTAKTGMNMFTQCVALEQRTRTYPVKIFAVAPGIMDTAMQTEIHQVHKEDFLEADKFIAYKEQGQLVAPDMVAKKVIMLLKSNKYESGTFIDIREMN